MTLMELVDALLSTASFDAQHRTRYHVDEQPAFRALWLKRAASTTPSNISEGTKDCEYQDIMSRCEDCFGTAKWLRKQQRRA